MTLHTMSKLRSGALVFFAGASLVAACSSFSETPGDDAGTTPDATPTDGPDTDALVPPDAPDQSLDGGPGDGGSLSAYAKVVLADSPALYFRFDEAAGATQFANDVDPLAPAKPVGPGVLSGVGGAIPTDPTNLAVAFTNANPGPSYISLNAATPLQTATQLTIELLVKTGAQSTDSVLLENVNSSALTSKGVVLRLHATGPLELSVGNGASNATYTSVAAVPSDNSWAHLVVSYDGLAGSSQGCAMWINGLQTAVAAVGMPGSPASTSPVVIGLDRFNTDAPAIYGGVLDELAIYTHVLPAVSVTKHYAASISP